MMKVKTKKDTEYISLYRELIVLEPSGNVDLTATLCRKEKNKSPDQKYCFAVGSLLLLQGIGISTVLYRAAWCTFQSQAPKIKNLYFTQKNFLILWRIELSSQKFKKLLYFSPKKFSCTLGNGTFYHRAQKNKKAILTWQDSCLSGHKRTP